MFFLKKFVEGVISSKFGFRWKPKKGWHSGLDITNKIDTEICAAYRGIVEYVGWRGNYGRTIILRHDSIGRVWTLYAHLNSFSCNCGDVVKEGQLIGRMGSTGYSTGPHVHFEVRVGVNGIVFAKDPQKFITGL